MTTIYIDTREHQLDSRAVIQMLVRTSFDKIVFVGPIDEEVKQAAIESGHTVEVAPSVPDGVRSMSGPWIINDSHANDGQTIDLSAVLTESVRAGRPIHVSGTLDHVQAKTHIATVNRLMADTGLPVTVIHTPN